MQGATYGVKMKKKKYMKYQISLQTLANFFCQHSLFCATKCDLSLMLQTKEAAKTLFCYRGICYYYKRKTGEGNHDSSKELRNVLLASINDMEETECFLTSQTLHFLYLASFVPNQMIHEEEKVMSPLRSQERPLSFLKGHGGVGVLPGML